MELIPLAFRFHELATGLPRHTGRLVVRERLREHVGSPEPTFVSLYAFDEEGAEYIRNHKTNNTRNPGRCALPWAPADFDHEADLETAQRQARAYVAKLQVSGVFSSHIAVWFSAGKGFHVEVPSAYFGSAFTTPSRDLPKTVRATMQHLLHPYDTADFSIYTTESLYRLPYTRHGKTGLYKIRLSLHELLNLTIAQIRDLAQTPDWKRAAARDDFDPRPDPAQIPDALKGFVRTSPAQTATAGTASARSERTTDEGTLPTRFRTCEHHMYQSEPLDGTRHELIRRMVPIMRWRGVSMDGAVALVQSWVDKGTPLSDPDYVARYAREVYAEGYQPHHCSDAVMQQHCDPRCVFFQTLRLSKGAQTARDVLMRQKARYQKGDDTLFNLTSVWPTTPYAFRRGETCLWTGYSKVGKSTVLENVLLGMRRPQPLDVMVFSLEQGTDLEYERLMQIAHGFRISVSEGVNEYATALQTRPVEGLMVPVEHLRVIGWDDCRLDTILLTIQDQKPDVVVVDSLGKVIVEHVRDDLVAQKVAFEKLQQQARKLGVLLIIVHHVKKGARPDRIELADLQGFGHVFQQAEHILAVQGNPKNHRTPRVLERLAARNHQPLELKLFGDPETFRWTTQPGDPQQQRLDYDEDEAPLYDEDDLFDPDQLDNAA